MNELEFTLETPLENVSGNDGTGITARSLLLKAPSGKTQMLASSLKSGVRRAQVKLIDQLPKSILEGGNEKESGDEKQTGEQFLELLQMGLPEKELLDYMEQFKKLICAQGICIVDDNIKMTTALYDMMSYRDIERLLGSYLEHFLA